MPEDRTEGYGLLAARELFVLTQARRRTGAGSTGEAIETLERIPLSTVSWTVKNSQWDDLVVLAERGRHGELQSRTAIPPDERYVTKWNGNPFQLDGGDAGRREDDGAFFLLPYWLGRYGHLLP